jgi:CRP-like cAMP-binding protein
MYAYVDEDDLPKQLAEGEVKEVPKRLLEVANQGGGHDNITAVVVRIGETSSTELAPRTTEVSLKLEVLKGMQMFRYMSYKELVRVSNIAEMIELSTDQVIFSTGQPGDAMYVVLSGAVRLTKGDTVVAELTRGNHFGEMALVDRSVRSLTATAVEGTRLVVIHRKDFYEIIKREPALATKMLWSFVQVLGARLRKTTNDLSDALHGEPRPGDRVRICSGLRGWRRWPIWWTRRRSDPTYPPRCVGAQRRGGDEACCEITPRAISPARLSAKGWLITQRYVPEAVKALAGTQLEAAGSA